MSTSRRKFITNGVALGIGTQLAGMSWTNASSYRRIIGANERLNIGMVGLGRRLGAFTEPISMPSANARLVYLCDVMQSQREKAAGTFAKLLDYKPTLEENFDKVINDKDVDAVILATPDHWHAPGTWMALQQGKHVYVEKPCSHNPREGELLVGFQKKYGKVVQMGNQQRSAPESIELMSMIHAGAIGKPYLAKAFYTNGRGQVPIAKPAAPPQGLNWELWQGPAPRKAYMHDTWDYNWHWYGWDYGTAETGNNATHEIDVARWALQVDFPEMVEVQAGKRHFADDGWTMYDTMLASFHFANGSTIQWDGASRNNHPAFHKGGRGTIIYGTEGSAYVDRGGYALYDRGGKLTKSQQGAGNEGGTQTGGGGDMSTIHVVNFFNSIRGTETQASPIEEGAKSSLLCHLANMAYRVYDQLKCDPKNGHILNNNDAKKLWSRSYEKGWEPPAL